MLDVQGINDDYLLSHRYQTLCAGALRTGMRHGITFPVKHFQHITHTVFIGCLFTIKGELPDRDSVLYSQGAKFVIVLATRYSWHSPAD